jgi:hypothetical protein
MLPEVVLMGSQLTVTRATLAVEVGAMAELVVKEEVVGLRVLAHRIQVYFLMVDMEALLSRKAVCKESSWAAVGEPVQQIIVQQLINIIAVELREEESLSPEQAYMLVADL